MKRKNRWLMIALVAVLTAGMLMGCRGSADIGETETTTAPTETKEPSTEATTEPAVTEEPTTEPIPQPEPVLSPDSAVDVYLKNRKLWLVKPTEYDYEQCSYLFLDLDFDGVLELIRCEYGGSGRFSTNRYFRINPESNTVTELSIPMEYDPDMYLDYDYCNMDPEETKLLKNSKGKMFYYSVDLSRITTGEYALNYGTMELLDGKVRYESLFEEYICEAGVYDNTTDVLKYSYFIDNKAIDVPLEDYQQRKIDYFMENQDQHLQWKSIYAGDILDLDYAGAKQLLLDTYLAFGYDSFSFDDLLTYDLPEEPEPEVPEELAHIRKNYMTDYQGLTMGDVVSIWGENYNVAEEWLYGGWGYIYYETTGCPFVFCYSDLTYSGDFKDDQPLEAVIAWPTAEDQDYYATDNVSVWASLDQITQHLEGEHYYSEMDEAVTFSATADNGENIHFVLSDDLSHPLEVSVSCS